MDDGDPTDEEMAAAHDIVSELEHDNPFMPFERAIEIAESRLGIRVPAHLGGRD